MPPARLQPGVPRDLNTICLKCLRKEPDRRYASARDLADDLQCYLDNRPIRARPVPAWERAPQVARRRPAQAALAVALLLLVACGAAGAVFYGLYQGLQATAYKHKLERRQRAEETRARGQQAEDDGRYAEAKDRYTQALGEIGDEADAAAEILRGQIAGRRDQVQQRLDKEAKERRVWDEQHKETDRVGRLDRDRGDILPRELGVTEQETGATALTLRRDSGCPGAVRFPRRHGHGGGGRRSAGALPEVRLTSGSRAGRSRSRTLVHPGRGRSYPSLPGGERTDRGTALVGPRRSPHPGQQAAAVPGGLRAPARYLVLLGDRKGADDAEARARETPPTTALDDFLTALDLYRQREFLSAAAACEKARRQQPDHFWAQFLQAVCNLRMQRWQQAKDGLTVCMRDRKDLLWAYLLRATACGVLGEVPEAEADFGRALELAGVDAFARWVILVNRGASRSRHRRRAGVVAP